MLRALLDVNVLVLGTLTPAGAAGVILDQWLEGTFTLVTCEELIAEYREVLSRPKFVKRYKGVTLQTIAASSSALREFSEVVTLSPPIPRVIRDDPEDDVVLECAAVGRADYIVSGDREHLLPLGQYQGVPIVPPAAFVQILDEESARKKAQIEQEKDRR